MTTSKINTTESKLLAFYVNGLTGDTFLTSTPVTDAWSWRY